MISIENVFNKMKLKELNVLIKMFGVNVRDRRKAEIVNVLSEYLKENVNEVLRKTIIYDEFIILKKLCDKEYDFIIEEGIVNKDIESLKSIGIVYVYDENEKRHVCIPLELRNSIKESLEDRCIIEFSKCRGRIIKMFYNLLELYGAFSITLLEEYIIREIGHGYRIHRSIEAIHMYNERNRMYDIDENMVYYNSNIVDLELVKSRIYNLYDEYRYYDKDEIEAALNMKSRHEENIYIILNRVYKNSKDASRVVKQVAFMVRQGSTTKDIGAFVKAKAKRISDFGLKNICRSVDLMRYDTIIWGLKGYTLGESQVISKIDNCVKAI